jgi:hypothetical protein
MKNTTKKEGKEIGNDKERACVRKDGGVYLVVVRTAGVHNDIHKVSNPPVDAPLLTVTAHTSTGITVTSRCASFMFNGGTNGLLSSSTGARLSSTASEASSLLALEKSADRRKS